MKVDQDKALSEMLYNKSNLFLTGAAGTGKTHLLNKLVEELNYREVNYAVTATTGIAAKHLFGSTVHSWSGMGINTELDHIIHSRQWHIAKKRIRSTDLLIIDEISMMGNNTFDLLNDLMQIAMNNINPFGGIRLIVVGDFFQLPPVKENYCFTSESWNDANFKILNMTENFRASNKDWLKILANIRIGEINQSVESMFKRRIRSTDEDITRLVCLNREADRINLRKLSEIKQPSKTYTYSVSDPHGIIKKSDVEKFFKNSVIKKKIELKIGAYMMITINHKDHEYVNGTCGKIIDMTDKHVFIETDDGDVVRVPVRHSFSAKRVINKDKKIKEGFIQAVPLIYGWACNIHKSQGVTLNKARLNLKNGFTDGQAYVAFSRIRSEDGVYLDTMPNPRCLTVNPQVINFVLNNIKAYTEA